MQEIVHEVFGDRPIGGEKLVADVQIRHDAAAGLERRQALIHRLVFENPVQFLSQSQRFKIRPEVEPQEVGTR